MTPFISMEKLLCVVVVLSMAHASVQLVEEKKVSNTIYCRPRFAHPHRCVVCDAMCGCSICDAGCCLILFSSPSLSFSFCFYPLLSHCYDVFQNLRCRAPRSSANNATNSVVVGNDQHNIRKVHGCENSPLFEFEGHATRTCETYIAKKTCYEM